MIVAAAGCLALGWWQWSRFESNSGSFQNLGYALQWPLFAGFCVYAYRKFVRYEESPPAGRQRAVTPAEIPAGLLPERPAPASEPTTPSCANTTPTWPSLPSTIAPNRTGPRNDR